MICTEEIRNKKSLCTYKGVFVRNKNLSPKQNIFNYSILVSRPSSKIPAPIHSPTSTWRCEPSFVWGGLKWLSGVPECPSHSGHFPHLIIYLPCCPLNGHRREAPVSLTLSLPRSIPQILCILCKLRLICIK